MHVKNFHLTAKMHQTQKLNTGKQEKSEFKSNTCHFWIDSFEAVKSEDVDAAGKQWKKQKGKVWTS